ncbi:MAG: adenylyl-sulfate kinase [Candidatus Margulisiibacteriota bacterium]
MNGRNLTWHHGKVNAAERGRGLVVWFTGLSGSGKSTIAVEVEKMLHDAGKPAFRLDGDNVRHGLNSDLGFSAADRAENIRRVAEVAALFREAGLITLVSFITPYEKLRRLVKEKVGAENMIMVYVKASVEVCAQRDPKRLYRKAQNGEVSDFTGVSAPYEEPERPDLVLDTEKLSVAEVAALVIDAINKRLTASI